MPSAKSELRLANESDVAALRGNWRLSFGDGEPYLDFFFSRRFVPENTVVACSDDRVIAQLFLLPADLRTGNDLLAADYLFAAATHPAYRGRGIMTSLLAAARTICAERRKDAIVLLPGTTELYRYYKNNGFKTAFYRRRLHITREALSALAAPIRETASAVCAVQSFFAGHDGLCWNADAIRYALDEHTAFRGKYASCKNAFVSLDGDEAFCVCAPKDFGLCAALLLGLSDLQSFTLVLPPDLPFGTAEDGGMICLLQEKPIQLRDAYLAFAME